MPTVLIDADGCPVVDLTIRICRAHGVPVLIFGRRRPATSQLHIRV